MKKLLKESSPHLDLIKTNKNEIRISVKLSDTGEVATLMLGRRLIEIKININIHKVVDEMYNNRSK